MNLYAAETYKINVESDKGNIALSAQGNCIIKIHRCLLVFLSLAGYLQLTISYVNGNICTVSGSFLFLQISYWLIVVALIYDFRCRLQRTYITNVLVNLFYFCFTVFVGFFVEEIAWNSELADITEKALWNNLILEGALLCGLILIIQRIVPSYTVFMIINFAYGLINYYLLTFKGCPPLIGDFLATGTAIEVMGEYDYTISDSILRSLYLVLVYFVIRKYTVPSEPKLMIYVRRIVNKNIYQQDVSSNKTKKNLRGVLIGAVLRILGIILALSIWAGVFVSRIIKKTGFTVNAWSPVGSFYSLGAPVTLMLSAYNLKMEEPKGYSSDKAKALLENYESDTANDELSVILKSTNKKPTVIAIMNESFSDLSALGEFESDEYLSFYRGLHSYVMKGNAYVSVVGGGTCNSEFEFLTGSTMAFLGTGIYPYRSYDLSKASSLAKIMKNQGYRAIALHPAQATNWNRDSAYPQLGFDDFISYESDTEWKYIRSWVSDASDYEKVKKIYEENKDNDEPLFLFNVTIQNHGGYTGELPDELEKVNIEEKYQSYTDVVKYLSLIRNADESLQELLEYFSEQDDPVIICFFGDHEPGLNDGFVSSVRNIQGTETVEDRQQLHQTPYFIWANYDTGIHNVDKNVSLNYLAANLLEVLGVETEYTKYLLDLEEDIPIINTEGYMTSDGDWKELSENNDRLEQYRQLQYYELTASKK